MIAPSALGLKMSASTAWMSSVSAISAPTRSATCSTAAVLTSASVSLAPSAARCSASRRPTLPTPWMATWRADMSSLPNTSRAQAFIPT